MRAGPGAHALEQRRERQDAGLDELRVERREGGLEAGDAERRLLERHLLLVTRVRRVVGRDRLDRPVAERVDQRCAIVVRPQRRVHLHVGIERAHRVLGQAEVVRRGLARVAWTPGRAGAAERLHGLACGEVEQVERPLLVRGEREVAVDHDALGHRRVAAEAELGRDEPLVDVAAARERRLLAVDGDRPVGCGAVLERPADEARRDDRTAVVREPGGAALGELDHLRQLGPFLRLRDGGEEADGHLRLLAARAR